MKLARFGSRKTCQNQENIWKEFLRIKSIGHRCSSEGFLAMEAREKLYHLDGGSTLLDFGCGAAELLTYYAQV